MDSPPVLPDLTLLRRIGAGSYGDVWLARTLTGVYRAVKIVDRARFPDDRPFQRELEGITRFQRSAGDQPRQLALLHVGRLDAQGLLYYVMELADDVDAGTDIDPERYEPLTFKSLRARRPVLPAAECVRLGVELARGLAGLHAVGLIHRDVKPSNIILVGGVPKLADIGLVSSREASVTALGTPGYSPPEGAGSLSADLWGLGRVLYELVTGLSTKEFPRLPPDFDRRADAAVLLELNEVVLRACEPEPHDRYANAQQMLDELLLIQAGRSVKDLNRTRARLRTLARAAGIAAVVALTVIVGLGVKNYFTLRQLAAQEAAARAQAERDERLARYTANLHIAQLAYNSGDFGLARAALRRDVPAAGETDLRGLEWRALWNETAGDAVRRLGDVGSAAIFRLELALDGTQAAAWSGGTSRIRLFDLATGAVRALAADIDQLGGFTADGARLLVRTPAAGIRLLDVASGQPGPVQLNDASIRTVVPDGRTVLLSRTTPAGERVWLWDMIDLREVAVREPAATDADRRLTLTAVTGDRARFALQWARNTAALWQNELAVWNAAAGAEAWRRTDLGTATAMEFSPDGRHLAIAILNGAVRLVAVDDGRVLQELRGQTGYVRALTFAPDGARLYAAGADQTVRGWNLARGEVVEVWRGHEGPVNAVRYFPTGGRALTASDDGTLCEWRLPLPPRVVARAGFWTHWMGEPLLSPDGGFIAATRADGSLVRVDTATLSPADVPWTGAFTALGFAPEGLRALSADGGLVIVDPATDTVQTTLLRVETAAPLDVVSASRDGGIAVLGHTDGTVTIWDCAARRVLTQEKRHASAVLTCAVSGDGAWAATGDRSGRVWLWRPDAGGAIKEVPHDGSMVFTLAFSSDARWLVIFREDGTMALLDPETLTIARRQPAHTTGANVAEFTADGTRLVSGGLDGLVLVWSVPDLRLLGALSFEPGPPVGYRAIAGLTLSVDQRDLIVLTDDGRLRRWNLRP